MIIQKACTLGRIYFDSKTKISNVSRTDAWMYDKKYPKNIGLMKRL